MEDIRYRNYMIECTLLREGKPYKYEWVADQYDGAPDASHNLCGCSYSLEEAYQGIDDQLIDYLRKENERLEKTVDYLMSEKRMGVD